MYKKESKKEILKIFEIFYKKEPWQESQIFIPFYLAIGGVVSYNLARLFIDFSKNPILCIFLSILFLILVFFILKLLEKFTKFLYIKFESYVSLKKEKEIKVLKSKLEQAKTKIKKIKKEKGFEELMLEGFTKIWTDVILSVEDIESKEICLRDPIYGNIVITEDLYPIYSHPLFQRLHYIKQLSFCYYPFNSATNTRLAHSVGTYFLMEKILKDLLNRDIIYSENKIENLNLSVKQKKEIFLKAKLLALIHDLGHGPFGHTLDLLYTTDIDNEQRKPDKFFGAKYITTFLKPTIEYISKENKVNIKDDNLEDILLNPNRTKLNFYDNLIAELLDYALDVDRLDYLARDSYSTGLNEGNITYNVISDNFVLFRQSDKIFLAFKKRAVEHIEHFIFARDSIFKVCYEHPIKVCFESLLRKAVRLLMQTDFEQSYDKLMLLTDKDLLNVLTLCSENEFVNEIANVLTTGIIYTQVCDEEISEYSESEKLKNLSKELSVRRRIKYAFVEEIANWEREILRSAGLDENKDFWKISISFGSPDTVFSPQIIHQKLQSIRILDKKNGKYVLNSLDKYSTLFSQEQFSIILRRARSRFRVFIHPSFEEAQIKSISEQVRRFLYDT